MVQGPTDTAQNCRPILKPNGNLRLASGPTRWARFEQPDRYGGSYDLTDPQSFNRYSYVRNDPVNFVDPTGLLPCEPGNYSAECGYGGFGGWGGGFNMNEHISLLRGSGRQTIVDAEYDHDYRYFPENGPFRFRSAFLFSSWFGWFSQNPAAAQTDCHRFADLVQGIANRTNSDDEFLDEMASTFTAANNSSIAEMRRTANNAIPAGRPTFGDSGFKPQFQDGSNQVRHFTAGFIAGAKLGVPGLLYMNQREGGHNPLPGNEPDVRLNGVSTNLGSTFTQRSDAVEFRRARLAAQIKEDVCQ